MVNLILMVMDQEFDKIVDRIYMVFVTAGLPIRWTLERCLEDIITRSGFKSETIFRFLGLNYTGQHT